MGATSSEGSGPGVASEAVSRKTDSRTLPGPHIVSCGTFLMNEDGTYTVTLPDGRLVDDPEWDYAVFAVDVTEGASVVGTITDATTVEFVGTGMNYVSWQIVRHGL